MFRIEIFIKIILLLAAASGNCSSYEAERNFNFKCYLIKSYHRSTQERLFVDNVNSLEACKILARKRKGLAFNYSPRERFSNQNKDEQTFRDHFWLQPHLFFNCHILQCPENAKFTTLIPDTAFDYFSLYEKPIDTPGYTCLPEIGLFVLHTVTQTFQNAVLQCRHMHDNCASLAYAASQRRTEALTRLLATYNDQQVFQTNEKVYLAFVSLHSSFSNGDREPLKCSHYLAWEPGNPKLESDFYNATCVALTLKRSWKTVTCKRKLAFICEIWKSCGKYEKDY